MSGRFILHYRELMQRFGEYKTLNSNKSQWIAEMGQDKAQFPICYQKDTAEFLPRVLSPENHGNLFL